MTEHAHATQPHIEVGKTAPATVDAPISMITEDNPHGNLPNDPKGFKRIEVKTPEDFMKEDRIREEKAAKEAAKEKK